MTQFRRWQHAGAAGGSQDRLVGGGRRGAIEPARPGAHHRFAAQSRRPAQMYGLCCGYEDLNDHDTLRHASTDVNGPGQGRPPGEFADLIAFGNGGLACGCDRPESLAA